MNKDELITYADYLLYQAIKKCANRFEAEDLVQETLLAAIIYMDKGNEINYPKTWLSSTLNHKYNDHLRRKYNKPIVSFNDISTEPACEDERFDNIMIAEEKEHLRREIAFLSNIYRDVIIRYYLKGDSVSSIAKSLSIPEGTVKSRLDSARKHIQKGFVNMEKYNKRSYEPERLNLCCSGISGFEGEPYSIVQNDLIAQNILILAYDMPVKEEELAHAIGIPLAYLEPIIDKLIKNELMKRQENGKVYTNFIIYTTEDSYKYIDAQISFVESNYRSLMEPILSEINKLQSAVTG